MTSWRLGEFRGRATDLFDLRDEVPAVVDADDPSPDDLAHVAMRRPIVQKLPHVHRDPALDLNQRNLSSCHRRRIR